MCNDQIIVIRFSTSSHVTILCWELSNPSLVILKYKIIVNYSCPTVLYRTSELILLLSNHIFMLVIQPLP